MGERWRYALDRTERNIAYLVHEKSDGTIEVEVQARFKDEDSAAAYVRSWNQSTLPAGTQDSPTDAIG